jgi:hypothetical protein
MPVNEKVKPEVTIDARGPRWSAVITTIVLAIALVTSNVWVAAFQAVVFAIGAIRGPQLTPYAIIFKKLIKPRLKSDATFEDVRPPQFAQSVGLVFALVAVIASVTGADGVFTIAVGFALAAAFLNSAFNFCLGCQVYLLLLRARVAK